MIGLRILALLIVIAQCVTARAETMFGDDDPVVQPWTLRCDSQSQQPPIGKCGFSVTITGELSEVSERLLSSSIHQLQTIRKTIGRDISLQVSLQSQGGRIRSALTMGRLLRAEGATASVGENKSCLSTCIFVLMGAVKRTIWPKSRIGIHRPFLDPPSLQNKTLTQQEIKAAMSSVRSQLLDYASEMNVPGSIVEDMLVIPSENVRLITSKQLAHYGILPVDPILKEATELEEAKKRGITRQEFIRRRQSALFECEPRLKTADRDDPFQVMIATLFTEFDPCFVKAMSRGR